MVLAKDQIKEKAIIDGEAAIGCRPTTYDATVGKTISEGSEHDGDTFKLPPRGIVWVVSAETFRIPEDVTGLATLKTQWTHDGVLALNVGIVDPGWNGPLSTALVNFSNANFTIKKGEPFFRLLFQEHEATGATKVEFEMDEYVKKTMLRSRLFATSFLNMESLSSEVAAKVLKLPRWGLILSFVAVIVSLIAIYAPISYSVWADHRGDQEDIAEIEEKLEVLDQMDERLQTLEERQSQLLEASGDQGLNNAPADTAAGG